MHAKLVTDIEFALPVRPFKAEDIILALKRNSDLFTLMQIDEHSQPPSGIVQRVLVCIEKISDKNSDAKAFGCKLADALQRQCPDVTRCIVKMSSPNLHCSGGVLSYMGQRTQSELNFTPMPIVQAKHVVNLVAQRRRRDIIDQNDVYNATTNVNINLAEDKMDVNIGQDFEAQTIREYSNTNFLAKKIDNVLNDDDVQANRCKRKQHRSDFFHHLIKANSEQLNDIRLEVDEDVRKQFINTVDIPSIKLDDLGDSVLHALHDLFCGSTNFRLAVSAKVAMHSNRTVVLSVFPARIYWCVVSYGWNAFVIEAMGSHTMPDDGVL